jgi:hypothetical protein
LYRKAGKRLCVFDNVMHAMNGFFILSSDSLYVNVGSDEPKLENAKLLSQPPTRRDAGQRMVGF